RLDENTGPENFLRHAFKLKVGSAEWEQLERGFREAFTIEISDVPRRTQNRLTEFTSPSPLLKAGQKGHAELNWTEFENEPDTDFSLPQNSEWAEHIVARKEPSTTKIPLVIAGEALAPNGAETSGCLDPSRPGAVLARYRIANEAEIDRAVSCATA